MKGIPSVEGLISLIEATARLEVPVHAETPVLSSGLIDSFDIVTLLSAIDQHYGIDIAPETIEAESFDTPVQMLSHILERRG